MEREDEKNERREGGGEGEAGARNPDWNIRGNNAPGLEHPGGGSPGLERPGRQQPGNGTSGTSEGGGNACGEKRRGAREQHGPAWTRCGRTRRTREGKWEEEEQKEKRPTTWNPDEDNRGGSAPGQVHPGARRPYGKERPELQEEEEAKVARINKR